MRKSLRGVACALIGFALIAAALLLPAPAQADVDAFVYESWNSAYALSVDANGRAIAQVTETVTPVFPESDQNRGLVRGIPLDFRGAATDPRDFSVTDPAGAAVPFEVEDDGGFRVVAVGDDRFVHGRHTYVIRYTISDVVLHRDDGSADEFYWDLMDFEHLQPVASFSATVTFAPELSTALDGNLRCYVGAAQSDQACEVSGSGTARDPVRIDSIPLDAHHGVTIAVGLRPGAVVQPPQRQPNVVLDVLPGAVGAVGLALGSVGTGLVRRFRNRRRTARGTIVAQYEVPSALPPLLAATIIDGAPSSPATAEIVHLAVCGATRLEDGPESGTVRRPEPTQLVRVVDPSRAADPLDQLALDTLVPGATPGAAVTLPRESTPFATQMTELVQAGNNAATTRGYLESVPAPGARAWGVAALGVAIALTGLGITGLSLRASPLPLVFLLAALLTAALGIYAVAPHRVHTSLGAETREYLEGVREFIRVAEAQRIEVLQSYTGAERAAHDDAQVILLYERLLPYAMLFGLEKEWSRVLETRYEADPGYIPNWYPSAALYGGRGVAEALRNYTGAVTQAVSYTASTAGGSTGGGFAGGGGGGGFSGGR